MTVTKLTKEYLDKAWKELDKKADAMLDRCTALAAAAGMFDEKKVDVKEPSSEPDMEKLL